MTPALRLDLLRPRLRAVPPVPYENAQHGGNQLGEVWSGETPMKKRSAKTGTVNDAIDPVDVIARELKKIPGGPSHVAVAALAELADSIGASDSDTGLTFEISLNEKRKGRSKKELMGQDGLHLAGGRHDAKRDPAGFKYRSGHLLATRSMPDAEQCEIALEMLRLLGNCFERLEATENGYSVVAELLSSRIAGQIADFRPSESLGRLNLRKGFRALAGRDFDQPSWVAGLQRCLRMAAFAKAQNQKREDNGLPPYDMGALNAPARFADLRERFPDLPRDLTSEILAVAFEMVAVNQGGAGNKGRRTVPRTVEFILDLLEKKRALAVEP